MQSLEEMRAFFAARVDIYDEHMRNEVEGCREGYARMPRCCRKASIRFWIWGVVRDWNWKASLPAFLICG